MNCPREISFVSSLPKSVMGDNLILFLLDIDWVMNIKIFTINSNIHSSLYMDIQNVVKAEFTSAILELIEWGRYGSHFNLIPTMHEILIF